MLRQFVWGSSKYPKPLVIHNIPAIDSVIEPYFLIAWYMIGDKTAAIIRSLMNHKGLFIGKYVPRMVSSADKEMLQNEAKKVSMPIW